MEKLILTGNVVRDPELNTTANNTEVCHFDLAVNKPNDGGANFYRVTAWGKLGNICSTYLTKGRKVCVIGRELNARLYSKNDGTAGVSLEITADDVEFLSPKSEQPQQPVQQSAPAKASQNNYPSYDAYDDMPF